MSSRARADLERLIEVAGLWAGIGQSAEEDQTWRFAATPRDLLDLMSALAETVDYERF